MAVERLNFAPQTPYHGFDASVHLSRYATARDLCQNVRVLDIACGEGYGSALLADWGAREVVGVDISPEAIAAATRNFPRPNTHYLCADAVAAEDPLASEEPFDLIVCFETFEHVSDAKLLLRRLAGWLRPGGAIVISCPNDPAAERLGFSNEFHLRPWTQEQFRDCCESVLGSATAWLLQTPCVGAMILPERNCNIKPDASFFSIMETRPIGSAQALPPQANILPDWSDCLAYVGIWGGLPAEQLVATPLSYTAYSLPWRNLGDGLTPVELQARYDGLVHAHRTSLEQCVELRARYNDLAGAHRTLLEQREQDRQQLLRYASDLVTIRRSASGGGAPTTSRIVHITGSPRALKLYLLALRMPVLGRLLRKLRGVVLQILSTVR